MKPAPGTDRSLCLGGPTLRVGNAIESGVGWLMPAQANLDPVDGSAVPFTLFDSRHARALKIAIHLLRAIVPVVSLRRKCQRDVFSKSLILWRPRPDSNGRPRP